MIWSTICREHTVLSLQPFEAGTLHPSHPSQTDLQFISLWLFAVVTKSGLFALLYNTTRQFCPWQSVFTPLMFAQHHKAITWKAAATELLTLSRWQKSISFWPPAMRELVTFRKSHPIVRAVITVWGLMIQFHVWCISTTGDVSAKIGECTEVSGLESTTNWMDFFFSYFVWLLFDLWYKSIIQANK